MLYGVRPADPVTFVAIALLLGAIALLLGAIALLASYLPGRRARRVDPTEAIRTE